MMIGTGDDNGETALKGPAARVLSCNCDNALCIARDRLLIPSCFAVFAVFGVAVRYGLGILFERSSEKVMGEWSPLFLDLPANMLGCFVMGFVAMAWRDSLMSYSEEVFVGLTTGFCGCLTTFASWNQRMAAMFAAGFWVRGLLGLLVGFELSFMSLLIGKDVGRAVMGAVRFRHKNPNADAAGSPAALDGGRSSSTPAPTCRRKYAQLAIFAVSWLLLMAGAISRTVTDSSSFRRRKLWMSIAISAPGVWLRWRLGALNRLSPGDPKRELLRWLAWMPLGTFAANMLGAAASAMLSVLALEYPTYWPKLVTSSIQMGFSGCLSTVSTFVLEVHKLRTSPKKQYQAYLYVITTHVTGVLLALAIYGIPVWIQRYPDALPSKLAAFGCG